MLITERYDDIEKPSVFWDIFNTFCLRNNSVAFEGHQLRIQINSEEFFQPSNNLRPCYFQVTD